MRPRIRAANGRILRGDMSACRYIALYSMTSSIAHRPACPSRPENLAPKFRGQDLNLRPPGYEPGELPLLHPGIGALRFGIGEGSPGELSIVEGRSPIEKPILPGPPCPCRRCARGTSGSGQTPRA